MVGSRRADIFLHVEADVGHIDPALRRRIASSLSSHRRELLTRWEERHRGLASLADPVADLGGWDRYRTMYLELLLRVLTMGIRRANPDYLHLYAQERTRFYEPAALRNGARAELAEALRGDTDDAVAVLGDRAAEAEAVRALLDALHAPILRDASARQARIVLVGDCLMTDIASFLRPKLDAVAVEAAIDHRYFSAALGRALSVADLVSDLEREGADIVGMSFLTYEGIPPYLALLAEADRLGDEERVRRVDQIDAVVRETIAEVRAASNVPIVLHGTCGLPLSHVREFVPFLPEFSRGRRRVIDLLNDRLRELAANTENVIFLDEHAAAERIGIRAAGRRLIPRMYTHGKVFHPSTLGTLLVEPYVEIVQAHRTLARCKVLLVDFDNTLWQGVMAEGEVEHDVDAQRLLKRLREAGILLVSVSKNDPESIRWDELELDPDDFVLHKVSWNLKAQSIEEAAHQLDLGLDSFVLIDDNPVERELVSTRLPQVTVMDPGDPATWRRLTLMLDFPNTRVTAEAARRTEMYREAAARRDALSGGADYPAMMRSLDLSVQFGPAAEHHLDRVHELVDRTNQFNTTTIRRSRAELAALIADPDWQVYVGTLADKFGRLGIVGVSIVHRDGDQLIFDSVIMSCRAMGFGFERVLLRGPIDAQTGCRAAIGRYRPTERNRPCAALFSDAGFAASEDGEWRLDLGGALPEIPDWLAFAAL